MAIRDAATFPLEDVHVRELGASHLHFDVPLPSQAERFCLVYEGVLRRMFRECVAFRDRVAVEDEVIRLNAVDDMSSTLIVEFLSHPTPGAYAQLQDLLRLRYAAGADVAALIVCRNLGIPARRIATREQWAAYWANLTNISPVRDMRGGPLGAAEMMARAAEYVVIDCEPPLVFCGQMSPLASATAQSLLVDKARASAFLQQCGHRVPAHVLVRDEGDLRGVGGFGPAGVDAIIFKPSHGSGRTAVVGPVASHDPARVLQCYRRCRDQMGKSATVIAEQYIRGAHCRINVNHGRVTFVAQSVRNEVEGDGAATLAELVMAQRQAAHPGSWPADAYIENVICGRGLDLRSIPHAGERVTISHDGNEGGRFLDVTDTFPDHLRAEALALADTCRCPVMGIDAIVDDAHRLWIVDVNTTRPAVSFFADLSRAYQTMDHMIRTVLNQSRITFEGVGVGS